MAKIDIETRKRIKAHVTKEDIKDGFKKLGLKTGDNVGVHSSLSAFGYVEGGADAVIDALLETVGEEGNKGTYPPLCRVSAERPGSIL